jgi:hypothetical protein
MYALMSLQSNASNECLITHITEKWSLTSMYALMFLQMTQPTE